ncbi:MAG TPA: hypothetical protein ENN14_00785, partial [Chloroflexi bacterium]|nr:hypothetical protein [Chloroflexota bacterium]
MNAPPSLIRYDTSPRSDLVRFFRVFRLAGRDLFEQMFVLGLTNIAAMLLLGAWTALPQLLPLAAFAPPLLAGLWSAAARVARAEETSFHDVWEGAQDHFARSWLLAAVSVVVYGVVWMNITFYTQENVPLPFEAGPWVVTLLLTFWLLAGIFWTLYWSYILAWLTFEEPHLWPALKGAAWLLISHGPFT